MEDNSKKPRDLLKNRNGDGLKKNQLSLFQGMTKKAEVIIVADNDDELRTSVSENPATATLCTEEFFVRTQYHV